MRFYDKILPPILHVEQPTINATPAGLNGKIKVHISKHALLETPDENEDTLTFELNIQNVETLKMLFCPEVNLDLKDNVVKLGGNKTTNFNHFEQFREIKILGI